MFLGHLIEAFTKWNLPTKIAVLFIVGLIGWVVLYSVLRKLKGSIRIEVPRGHRFRPGEVIKGAAHISVRSSTSANRITAHLKATTIETRSSGKSQSRKTVVHFEQSLVLVERATLVSGRLTTFPFEFELPRGVDMANAVGADQVEKLIGGKFGSMLSVMMRAAAENSRQRLKWHIQVEVDMPGIDISQSTPIDVGAMPSLRDTNVQTGTI